ncbi:MAG TPA: peptidoglycan editing factor PgeF [Vicinamibacteria bacterium]|nr:peptidoglycan editing factor PgeF [Vicinamibacteria bacterium]
MASTGAVTTRAAKSALLDAIPGLVHGFEQRPEDAPREDREATRARVARAVAPFGRLHLMHQVHGARVQRAPWEGRPEGDVALTDTPGELVGVETADCLPVLIADPRRRVAAAVHAGWRGTLAGAARTAVAALVAEGSEPADLVAAAGPCNAACCYEVGPDVRDAFGDPGRDLFRPGRGERPHLDVRAANVRQLVEAGVPRGQIDAIDHCTSCRPDLYHSYRREGKGGGRMVNWIGFSR